MRSAIALVLAGLALVATSARAHADEPAVALLLDPPARAEIGRELLVALAERHARVLAGGPPRGDTPLVRAAVAQRMARALGAQVAVWSELGTRGAELHAVTTDGSEVHRAPLPGALEVLEPRVVATVAASLVDELWSEGGTPAPLEPVQLTVEIRVEPAAPPAPERPIRPTTVARAEAAAPAPAPESAVVASSAGPADAAGSSGWLLAGGGALQGSGLASLELRLDWRGASGLRLGGWSTFGHVFAEDSWNAAAFGVGLAGSQALGGPTLEYGLFAGFDYMSEHEEPGVSWTGGLGAVLVGGRLGLGVPLAHEWSVRVEVSAALAETSQRGGVVWSWLSLLVERRL